MSVFLGMEASAASVATHVPPQERHAYYGDLHLHTGYSFDAYLIGTRIGPDEAYRFARGETVTIGGMPYRRTTPPLDFLAVTDHAEWMNVPDAWQSPQSAPFLNELYRKFSTALKDSFETYLRLGWPSHPELPSGADMNAVTRSAWQRQVEAANRHNRPGEFTTLPGYEWTLEARMGDGVLTLHRNVIFGGDDPPAPFSSIDFKQIEDLWQALDQRRNQGQQILAIAGHPHRSYGKMFDGADSDGRPLDKAEAEQRAANERLLEIVQSSGASEADPELSPADEYAAFDRRLPATKFATSAKPERGSFARYALSEGMRIARRNNGANPYKFGFVGSSDFHNGLSDSAEVLAGQGSSAGLTGVWAESNTREAIFAALQRRETFATSGTRLQLRFFGGWSYEPSLLNKRHWLRTAYRQGVSMGSDLPTRPPGQRAPSFIAEARRDGDGANLDRLQIVKVWLDGDRHAEKIYDVARTDAVGAPMLATIWRDPDFDPSQPAAYYLRALEIPTPRRAPKLPPDAPEVIQERGWASPIWYTTIAGAPAETIGR